MASLVSDTQKVAWQSAMQNVADTFSRTIKAFKDGKEIILSSDMTYNHIYKQPLGNTTREPVQRDIQARIFYFPRKLSTDVIGDDSLKVQQPVEEVRIKINKADYDFISEAVRFVFDGHTYSKGSTEAPHGLFSSGFYTIYLSRTS